MLRVTINLKGDLTIEQAGALVNAVRAVVPKGTQLRVDGPVADEAARQSDALRPWTEAPDEEWDAD